MQRGDEIGSLAKRFNQMATRLQQLVEGHKRLLGDISHELRSPLARMQVALELARQDSGDKVSPYLSRAEKQADELDKLIEELLSFSRLDFKPYELDRQTMHVHELVEEVVSAHRELATKGGVELRMDIAADIGPVDVDKRLLQRALANLVSNGIAHSPPDSVLKIAAQERAGSLELQVADQGPGVRVDLLDKIFEPFFRAETSRERASGGVGLGLAIVRRCMQAHGGQARAELLRPSGLSVILSLPIGGSA